MQTTIMVVEDDEKISFLLNFLLTRQGFHVLKSTDGDRASEWIAANGPPDLVLLDIMLPHKDGYAVLSEIRAKPSWKDVPVMMLTAKAQGTDITRALDQGANDYLIKPFQTDELVARIKRFLKK